MPIWTLALMWAAAHANAPAERPPAERPPVEVGLPLPMAARDALDTVGIDPARDAGDGLLLLAFGPAIGGDDASRAAMTEAFEQHRVSLVWVCPRGSDPEALDQSLGRTVEDFDGRVARACRVTLTQPGPRDATVLLIDRGGVVRAIDRPGALTAAALRTLVTAWRRGETIYDGLCARCHGGDGRDTSGYPGVVSLEGIGRRLSVPQIIEATRKTGAVNLDRFSRYDLEAMARYVAGL